MNPQWQQQQEEGQQFQVPQLHSGSGSVFGEPWISTIFQNFMPANTSVPYGPGSTPQFTGPPQQTQGSSLQQPLQKQKQTARGSPEISWALSEDERQSYTKIFRAWDTQGAGFISGGAGLEIFGQSPLSPYELGCIWDLADSTNRGSLNLPEFQVAMGLIRRAMNGAPIPTDLPPELVPSSKISWALSEYELQSYTKIFRAWDPQGAGFISGEAGLKIFGQSGLSPYKLGCIWGLADSTNRGSLNLPEFQAAMGLIYRAMNGAPIPTDLPPELVPSSKISWALSEDELQRYGRIFYAGTPQGAGFISGEAGLKIFGQSGLSPYELGCIWDLADSTNRGSLNLPEFQVAMGLIQRAMNGARIPTVLPAELAPSSERHPGDSVNIRKDILSQDSHESTSNGSSLYQQDGKIRLFRGTPEGEPVNRSEKDATYIHDDSDTRIYKGSSRHLDRHTIRYGKESSASDLHEMKHQSESASSQRDARVEVQNGRTRKDGGLEDELSDLKYRIKEVPEDLDQTTRAPPNVRKDEQLQRLEKELLELQDEIPG